MKNRKHYIIIENPNSESNRDKYLVVPEKEEYNPKDLHHYKGTLEDAQWVANRHNTTYYTSDYAEDEIKEFYDSIPFDQVEDAINSRLCLNLSFKRELVFSKGYWRVNFESNEDLCKWNFMLARMVKSCHLSGFTSSIAVNEKTGELHMGISIVWKYEHHGCGSNACNFANVWYTKKEGLIVSFEEDDRKEGR